MTDLKVATFADHLVFERQQPSTGGFSFEWAHEIQPSEIEWTVRDLLPARGYGFAYGESGAGKSFYTSDTGLRIAAGMQVHGKRTKRVGVVYIAAEGAGGVKKRIAAWRREHGVRGPIPFAVISQPPRLGSAVVGNDGEYSFEALLAQLDVIAASMKQMGVELGLVIVDTLAASMAGGLEENSAGDASAVGDDLKTISQRFNCFTLAVHHAGVTTGDRMRGSSAFNAGGDLTIQIKRDEALRTVTYQKVRDGEDGHKYAFRLDPVTLGHDDEGEPIKAAIVVFEDVPDDLTPRSAKLSPNATILRQALGRMIDDGLTLLTPTLPGFPAGARAVDEDALKAFAGQIGLFDEGDTQVNRRQKWHAAKTGLINAKLLRVEGKFYIPLGPLGGVRP